jgi:hypothetical protein
MVSNKVKRIGSRSEVYHGNATKTSGGLTKSDLVKNKFGYIVSRKKSSMARQKKFNPLLSKGLLVKKGSREFGVDQMRKKNSKNSKNSKKSKKNRTIFNHIKDLF